MKNLLKKEFLLSMHPITPALLLLSAMVIIPNYPYGVIFFYMSLAIFFTCLTGRENFDVVYSLTLPVGKEAIIKARICFAVILQMAQLLLTGAFCLLRSHLLSYGNEAGMDANLALLAEGLLFFGVFNLVFFGSYYRNVSKVGISFIKASIVFFFCIAADVAVTHGAPYVRDRLDTPDPAYMGDKLVFAAVCAVIYVILTGLAVSVSKKRFARQDLA